MALFLVNLDERTRALMLAELERDLANNALHISPLLSGQGVHDYPQLLRQAMASEDESWLADQLNERRRIDRTQVRRQQQGGYGLVTTPRNAADMIAESEFNRYYIRALCLRALEDGVEALIVYRARPSQNPRARSEELVETTVDPAALLEDLREHVGEPPAMGIPGGPNSGISVRLP